MKLHNLALILSACLSMHTVLPSDSESSDTERELVQLRPVSVSKERLLQTYEKQIANKGYPIHQIHLTYVIGDSVNPDAAIAAPALSLKKLEAFKRLAVKTFRAYAYVDGNYYSVFLSFFGPQEQLSSLRKKRVESIADQVIEQVTFEDFIK